MRNRFRLPFPALVLVSIVVVSAAMHARHFNKEIIGLHAWRQTETQSTINNFYGEDMNIFNPRCNDRGSGEGFHRVEFPLMQWLVASIYKLFGNHLIITRIFMFITGLFSVFGIYKMIKLILGDELPAVIGAWAFNFSPVFYYHTINPMPDNFALCCAIWGIVTFFSWIKNHRLKNLLLSGVFLCLAALCKLPFILYFSMPVLFFLLVRPATISYKLQDQLKKASLFSLFILPVLAWYIRVVPEWHGNGIVRGILDNNAPASVLLDNLKHHFFITLPENLLNYGSVLFFIAGFYFIIVNNKHKHFLFPVFAAWGLALVMFFLFELNMIGKSHDYYLIPFLPLLFILTAYGAWRLYLQPGRLLKVIVILLLLILPILVALRIDGRWNPEKPGFNKDLLVYKEDLRRAVPNDALCVAGNDNSDHIFFYYIDKKGWGFSNDELNDTELRQMISEGAKYLYTDSRKVEENAAIAPFLGELNMEKGSIRIYKLKETVEAANH